MKDLASGLAGTCVVELPDPKAFTIVPSGGTEWIKGKFAFKFRDVFEDYYAQPVEKGNELAPHILFARSQNDVESIIQFTKEWGPLHQPRQERPLTGFDHRIFTEEELSDREQYFAFTPFWWQSAQTRFKDVMDRLARPKWEPWESGLEEYIPLTTHTISFSILRRRDALAPRVRAGSLIEAFWLMLWLDMAEEGRRIRMCANTRCKTRVFRTGRSDQIYCSPACKELVNKRLWWAKTGSDARRARRKSKKKSRRFKRQIR